MLINEILNWVIKNYIESIASFLGLISVYFAIKEKPFFWILSISYAILFIFVYFNKQIYALMVLQIMYVAVGFLGFFHWLKGDQNSQKVSIIKITKKEVFIYSVLFVLIYVIITVLLKKFTDSDVYYFDSLISTFAIIASILTMKKILQCWLLWMTSDLVTICFFLTQKMYGVVVMYVFMFVGSIIGYLKWKREFDRKQINQSVDNLNL